MRSNWPTALIDQTGSEAIGDSKTSSQVLGSGRAGGVAGGTDRRSRPTISAAWSSGGPEQAPSQTPLRRRRTFTTSPGSNTVRRGDHAEPRRPPLHNGESRERELEVFSPHLRMCARFSGFAHNPRDRPTARSAGRTATTTRDRGGSSMPGSWPRRSGIAVSTFASCAKSGEGARQGDSMFAVWRVSPNPMHGNVGRISLIII
jgi:hypothetical protein